MEHFVTGVEFGDERISVIHANIAEDGSINVLSFASKPSRGTVFKGEIIDVNGICGILKDVMDESEKMLPYTLDRGDQRVFCLTNDHRIVSKQASASVQIKSSNKKITQDDIDEVTDRAEHNIFLSDMEQIAAFDGCFFIDDVVRESKVLGKIADKLTARPHIIFAPKKQIETIRCIFDELGFERSASPLFSPIAASFATLTHDEREHGALLFDFGYGVCSYAFIFKDGILLSGSIPVGVNNVINDLSVGLELPIEFCNTFIRENRRKQLHDNNQNFVEYQSANKVRKIPRTSFERVIDFRLLETFTLMNDILKKENLINVAPDLTIVLTGAGSLISEAPDTMKSVFSLPVRCGLSLKSSGVEISSFMPEPCCAALLGLVKEIEEFNYETGKRSPLTELFSGFGNKIINVIKSIG